MVIQFLYVILRKMFDANKIGIHCRGGGPALLPRYYVSEICCPCETRPQAFCHLNCYISKTCGEFTSLSWIQFFIKK